MVKVFVGDAEDLAIDFMQLLVIALAARLYDQGIIDDNFFEKVIPEINKRWRSMGYNQQIINEVLNEYSKTFGPETLKRAKNGD